MMRHVPNPPTPDAGADRGARPARGLRGRLDSPAGPVAPGTGLLVGGWVVHERLRVDQVLVTVDDDVVGHTRVDVPRPDVRERWPDVHGASHRGWAVTVPPVTGDEVTVRAYALVQAGPTGAAGGAGDDDAARLGPWIRFAELTVPVVASGDSYGRIDDLGDVAPGRLRVTGTAYAPGGLARVELHGPDPDEGWVRARHSLPVPAATADPEARVAGFAGYVRVPSVGAGDTVRAVAVAVDGSRHELEPASLHLVPAPAPATTPDRVTALLDRFEQRVRALRSVTGQQPPRVLVASHALDLGGAQLYLSLLVDRLRERGLDFCVAARSVGPLAADLEAAGIPYLVFGADPRDREVLEGQVLQVAEFAVEHGAVGCLANSLPTFPAVIAAQRLGLPTSWAVHESFDLDVFWAEAYGGLPAQVTDPAREALAASDEVVLEARATDALYADLVPDAQRSLVPYGVDQTAIDACLATTSQAQARQQVGLDPDALVLACVGTVEARKAQLSLVRAFARIPAERRRGVQLAVVGMNGSPYARALRDFVADSGLSDDVVLIDVTPDIHPCYLAADVLVSASDVESVPRTMLEAMLMGRPVAATAAFGVTELVTDGTTGWLCEPLDLVELQRALERVVATDRATVAGMGAAAREHVLRAHDASTYVDHFERRLSGWVRESGR